MSDRGQDCRIHWKRWAGGPGLGWAGCTAAQPSTQDKGILYRSDKNAVPVGYYDAAHNQYTSDRKAHHCNTIHLFGGPISVDSKKFDDPGDSTPYNEYMALYYCSRRAMWTRNIIREINYYNESLIYYMIQHAMILYGDNDTATARAKERKMTMNDRHVALKYHTVRDWVTKGQLETRRVASKENGSDLGTKAVSGPIMDSLYLPMKGYIREVTQIFNEHEIQVSHSKVYQIQAQRDDIEAGRPNTRVIRPLPKQAQFKPVGKRGERY
eukprot:COSAG02_NODE_363_length_23785_cov_21.830828_2_plen_268_part_00